MQPPFAKQLDEPFPYSHNEFIDAISAKNGRLYLIPYLAQKVVSYNPRDETWREIGENDLGTGRKGKWFKGVLLDDGETIVCALYNSDKILIIHTMDETTDLVAFPQRNSGKQCKYKTCTLDGLGNILFFPFNASKILKMNGRTKNVSIIDDVNVGKSWHCVIRCSSNGFLYAISSNNRVLKFDPANYSFQKKTISLGDDTNQRLVRQNLYTDVVDHKDGSLYALPNNASKVLKINSKTLDMTTIGEHLGDKWERCIIGNDDCIYGIPYNARGVLRFDPLEEDSTFIKGWYNTSWNGDRQTRCTFGCLASDNIIYCFPIQIFYSSDDDQGMLQIVTSRWEVIGGHIALRSLVERGRASSTILDVDKDYVEFHNDFKARYYVRFIEDCEDDVFRAILRFL